MKTLQECKDEVAKQNGFPSWITLKGDDIGYLELTDKVAKLYAQSAIEEIQSNVIKTEKIKCRCACHTYDGYVKHVLPCCNKGYHEILTSPVDPESLKVELK